jgi:DNA mismatch repair protein MutS
MVIDPATRTSLEIEKATSGARDGSLLAAIDRTITAPGARLLAARLARPLLDPAAIDARLDAVAWFSSTAPQRQKLREAAEGPWATWPARSPAWRWAAAARAISAPARRLWPRRADHRPLRRDRDPLVQPPEEIAAALGP